MVTKKTIIYTKNDWLIGSSVYTEDPTNTKMFKHKKLWVVIKVFCTSPVDIGHKLSVHKTFNLRPVSTGYTAKDK